MHASLAVVLLCKGTLKGAGGGAAPTCMHPRICWRADRKKTKQGQSAIASTHKENLKSCMHMHLSHLVTLRHPDGPWLEPIQLIQRPCHGHVCYEVERLRVLVIRLLLGDEGLGGHEAIVHGADGLAVTNGKACREKGGGVEYVLC